MTLPLTGLLESLRMYWELFLRGFHFFEYPRQTFVTCMLLLSTAVGLIGGFLIRRERANILRILGQQPADISENDWVAWQDEVRDAQAKATSATADILFARRDHNDLKDDFTEERNRVDEMLRELSTRTLNQDARISAQREFFLKNIATVISLVQGFAHSREFQHVARPRKKKTAAKRKIR